MHEMLQFAIINLYIYMHTYIGVKLYVKYKTFLQTAAFITEQFAVKLTSKNSEQICQ